LFPNKPSRSFYPKTWSRLAKLTRRTIRDGFTRHSDVFRVSVRAETKAELERKNAKLNGDICHARQKSCFDPNRTEALFGRIP
jgi:hypothetical protein